MSTDANPEANGASFADGTRGVDGADGSADIEDATVVVTFDDATIVVAQNDATVAVASPDRTVVVTGSRPNSGGAPVEEPEEIPASLARLFFKAPLDPKRRAPEAPFPKDRSSLPRGGVRSGIPVVYGTRAEELKAAPEGTDFAKWIGPPPEGRDVGAADRSTLISTERLNRKFRRIALFGGAGVTAVSAVGLWWVIDSLF